jgi:hypothetical protein
MRFVLAGNRGGGVERETVITGNREPVLGVPKPMPGSRGVAWVLEKELWVSDPTPWFSGLMPGIPSFKETIYPSRFEGKLPPDPRRGGFTT